MGTRGTVAELARIARLDGAARRAVGAAERLLGGLGRGEIIYLIGVAGHPNLGDELVLRIWLRHLARVRPTATVVVDVAHVGEAAWLFAGDHPRAVFVDTLWRLARAADENPDLRSGTAAQDWVAGAATDMRIAPGLAEGVDHLLRAASIHVIGGGYVNRQWPQWFPVISAVAAVARRTGTPAYASGLGLLPLPEAADLERFLGDAAAFAVFDVRDRPSFEALRGVPGASFTGDDVWLGLDTAAGRPGIGRGFGRAPAVPALPGEVVLCMQEDLSEGFVRGGLSGAPALAALARDVLDAWDVPGDRVTVVEGIPGHDYTVPKLLGDRIDGARIIPFLDVWRTGLPVGEGRTWISSRFHPHLLAAAAGDSGVAVVPKREYYDIKHGSLIDAGSRWTVVDDAAPLPARPDAGGFPEADRRANVARKAALAETLYPRP
ncbi:polysaccharide pyruvyl transferase family protein [Tsukamurella tyrosinosolvens]|uniref:polysaccharide pyruvyl transferase family protein n=1 Tax=Tsukamurella tyrosinosolvens TaxID=57704 RepID=UPI002DD4448E|nr:polysaccharide pyruvyl transferase family protein [Tsukamurella tyrosinosolvens]MEC4613629.1 polysaccharide pyruvyl transferase family protein [Tsukamurella tyrosinosolvens]